MNYSSKPKLAALALSAALLSFSGNQAFAARDTGPVEVELGKTLQVECFYKYNPWKASLPNIYIVSKNGTRVLEGYGHNITKEKCVSAAIESICADKSLVDVSQVAITSPKNSIFDPESIRALNAAFPGPIVFGGLFSGVAYAGCPRQVTLSDETTITRDFFNE